MAKAGGHWAGSRSLSGWLVDCLFDWSVIKLLAWMLAGYLLVWMVD